MSFKNYLKETIATKAIIGILRKVDPIELAEKAGQAVDEVLDAQLKDKKSEEVQSVVVPWLQKFVTKFNEVLLGDQ